MMQSKYMQRNSCRFQVTKLNIGHIAFSYRVPPIDRQFPTLLVLPGFTDWFSSTRKLPLLRDILLSTKVPKQHGCDSFYKRGQMLRYLYFKAGAKLMIEDVLVKFTAARMRAWKINENKARCAHPVGEQELWNLQYESRKWLYHRLDQSHVTGWLSMQNFIAIDSLSGQKVKQMDMLWTI